MFAEIRELEGVTGRRGGGREKMLQLNYLGCEFISVSGPRQMRKESDCIKMAKDDGERKKR